MLSERGSIVIATILVLSLAGSVTSGTDRTKRTASQQLNKTTVQDHYVPFSANNIFAYYANNGDGAYNPATNSGLFEFPKGGYKSAIFEDGLLWGCY
jgi:hypothetical protein